MNPTTMQPDAPPLSPTSRVMPRRADKGKTMSSIGPRRRCGCS